MVARDVMRRESGHAEGIVEFSNQLMLVPVATPRGMVADDRVSPAMNSVTMVMTSHTTEGMMLGARA
jgi:hypothetical protein